jgi:hypothetical protein
MKQGARMTKPAAKTYKDMQVTRVELKLVRLIQQDAHRESRSDAAQIKHILRRHYGLLNGQPEPK